MAREMYKPEEIVNLGKRCTSQRYANCSSSFRSTVWDKQEKFLYFFSSNFNAAELMQ